jgi:hypothetical protein
MYYQLAYSNLNMLSLAATIDSGCMRFKKLVLFITCYFILLHLNFIYIIILLFNIET